MEAFRDIRHLFQACPACGQASTLPHPCSYLGPPYFGQPTIRVSCGRCGYRIGDYAPLNADADA